ncbi:MAG: nitroreductase family protein [Oscillospiraceae bacterium]|nr:nitroreductase family protein [Oscillospiraceae bacterium]
MELKKAIEDRRSIRKFKTDAVSDNLIEELLNSAILAPSPKNRQPWKVSILKDEKKNKIADMMLDWREKNNGKMTMKMTANVIKEAPILLLVYREGKGEEKDHEMVSIGAFIEHICLAATDMNLGSLWIGYVCYIEQEINEYLHISNSELVSAVSIGYPNEYPSKRPRRELKDILI